MLAEQDWRTRAGCRFLSPDETDSIFFPGSGGKPTKAKSFCDSVSCPVMDICLKNAIENNLKGFWAGTTEDERKIMAQFFHIVPKTVDEFMPEEPVRKRKVYRKVAVSAVVTTLEFLDELSSPFD